MACLASHPFPPIQGERGEGEDTHGLVAAAGRSEEKFVLISRASNKGILFKKKILSVPTDGGGRTDEER